MALFSLSAPIKQIISEALDSLITELGKQCLLVYPPRWEPCANCVVDPIGKKSTNRWKTGGPMQFQAGTTCPMCNGNGKLAQENSEQIQFLCAWEPKQFFYPIPNLDIRVPYSIVQIKGYLSDLPKLLRAEYLIFQVDTLQPILRQKYKLFGVPGDRSNIIQGRYFVAALEQFNG